MISEQFTFVCLFNLNVVSAKPQKSYISAILVLHSLHMVKYIYKFMFEYPRDSIFYIKISQ